MQIRVTGAKEVAHDIRTMGPKITRRLRQYAQAELPQWVSLTKDSIDHFVYNVVQPQQYKRKGYLSQFVAGKVTETKEGGALTVTTEIHDQPEKVPLRRYGRGESAFGSPRGRTPFEIEEGGPLMYPDADPKAGQPRRGWLNAAVNISKIAFAKVGAIIDEVIK